MKTAKQNLPTPDQIAARAHEIFLQRGAQPGREKDDWLQAEYELMRLPVRKLAELETPAPKKGRRRSALINLVQAAVILSSTLPRFTR